MTTRAVIKHLQISTQRIRSEFRAKYDMKKFHPIRKQEARLRPLACAPANVREYSRAEVSKRKIYL